MLRKSVIAAAFAGLMLGTPAIVGAAEAAPSHHHHAHSAQAGPSHYGAPRYGVDHRRYDAPRPAAASAPNAICLAFSLIGGC
jgi:hypothetical protein